MSPSTAIRDAVLTDLNAESASQIFDQLYNNELDLAWLKNAVPESVVSQGAKGLSAPGLDWYEPNKGIPGINIRLLGVPASPTGNTPVGPSEEAYVNGDLAYQDSISNIFGSKWDIESCFESVMSSLADGRTALRPTFADGTRFSSCNVRLLPESQSIIPHVDYHYNLPIYKRISGYMDTTTLVSFFMVLSKPASGGDLVLFDLTNGSPRVPMLANGRSDMARIEAEFSQKKYGPEPGDMIIFAAGRCYHKVEKVIGPEPRVTIGGFAALDSQRKNVFYWG